ncbi:MAG: succinate dehydrogenase assembly factor 2 [Mariprofundus sp.]|nr:succinate dehydrogenase assembly factor 2 [Mariprofundus sp.]
MQESELAIRRMCYRLNRQGLLELDAWLANLHGADFKKVDVVEAIELLLTSEPPELQAMMRGERALPVLLKEWLVCA